MGQMLALQAATSIVAAVPSACMAAVLYADLVVGMIVFVAFEITFPLGMICLGRRLRQQREELRHEEHAVAVGANDLLAPIKLSTDPDDDLV